MNLINLLDKKWVIPVATGITGSGLGVAGGYVLGIRKATQKLAEAYSNLEVLSADLEEKIADVMSQLDSLDQDIQEKIADEPEVPPAVQGETVLFERVISEEEAKWIITNEQNYQEMVTYSEPEPEPEPEPELINTFSEHSAHGDTWDEVAEIQSRNPETPYVIHEDEYFEDIMHYKQMALTYYAGDNIMCDDKDIPIYGYNKVTGDLKFGHGSSSKDTVYVRNEQLLGEYEVTYDAGHYQIEVIGAQTEDVLMHSTYSTGLRKFKDE